LQKSQKKPYKIASQFQKYPTSQNIGFLFEFAQFNNTRIFDYLGKIHECEC